MIRTASIGQSVLLTAIAKLDNTDVSTNAQFITYAMLQMSSKQRRHLAATHDTTVIRQQLRRHGVNLSDDQFNLAYAFLLGTVHKTIQGQ